jgi:transcriptional regulator with XRE-family HTH domain
MIVLRIREVAKRQGINQRQLAERAGVHIGTIRRYWRRPTLRVKTSMLMKLAEAMKVSIRDLIEDVPGDAEGHAADTITE